ncbi:MAG: hypothetical protein KAS67_07150 [Thermoplasmata archaeon]|nr:hypothetical protein [Thermoplasmata archaeon]
MRERVRIIGALVIFMCMLLAMFNIITMPVNAGPTISPIIMDATDGIGTVYEDGGGIEVGLVANGTSWIIGKNLTVTQYTVAHCPEELADSGGNVPGGDYMQYDAGLHWSMGFFEWVGKDSVWLTQLESGLTYTHNSATVTTTTNYSAAKIVLMDNNNPQWDSVPYPTLEPIPTPSYSGGILSWSDWVDPVTGAVCTGWNVYYSDTGIARGDYILDGVAPAGSGSYSISPHSYYVIEPLWDNTGGSPSAYPNWLFSDYAASTPAKGLTISKISADDINVTWTNPFDNDFWDIYASQDKWAVREPANLIGTVPSGAGTFTHTGAQSDGQNWFYVVVGRSSGGNESINSTMVYKIVQTLYGNDPASGLPNINYVSLPWNTSYYPDTFSIVQDIEGGTSGGFNAFLAMVGKWGPATQSFTAISSYAPGPIPPPGWVNNFVIAPGDGIALILADLGAPYPVTYDWVMIGSDVVDAVTLIGNDPTSDYPSINWISLPISGIYSTSFDVVDDIEGGHGAGNGNTITLVESWNPQGQTGYPLTYYSPGPIPPSNWYNEFSIALGAPIAVALQDKGMDWTYDWTISLITLEVP